MCVAGLNVTTQACRHRWYELLRACSDQHSLANCPSKLQLEGWETRKETCPWCDGGSSGEEFVADTTHRLFGSTSSPSGSISSSPVLSAMGKPQLRRCDTDSTLSSLSRTGSFSSNNGSERGQKHREMNDRFRQYLTMLPHEVLPSARKNYPGSVASPQNEASVSADAASMRSGRRRFGAGWRKSISFGRSMFAS
jgi:hypothetical protein